MAIKELSLPSLQIPGLPTARTGETVVNPGDVYLWQQDASAVKKQIIQLKENKKRAYALVIGQCLPNLDSKLQGSAAFMQAEADQDVMQLLLQSYEGTAAALTTTNRARGPSSKQSIECQRTTKAMM